MKSSVRTPQPLREMSDLEEWMATQVYGAGLDRTRAGICPRCTQPVPFHTNYCWHCGQAVYREGDEVLHETLERNLKRLHRRKAT